MTPERPLANLPTWGLPYGTSHVPQLIYPSWRLHYDTSQTPAI